MSGLKLNPAVKYTLEFNTFSIFHKMLSVIAMRRHKNINITYWRGNCHLKSQVQFPRALRLIKITKKT